MPARVTGEQSGLTLVELLVGMSLMLIVLGAALLGVQTMDAVGSRNTKLNDSQQSARLASDRIAKDLRNLASPTPARPAAIDEATATNLIFQMVDKVAPTGTPTVNPANVSRARYCFDAARSAIWRQVQTWGDAVPAIPAASTGPGAQCPAPSGWTKTQRVASDVVNDPSVNPPFSYNSATTTSINQINTHVVVDINGPAKRPPPVSIATGVFLRNQNQRPSATFVHNPLGNRRVRLNGSASSDPEGGILKYYWYVGSSPSCPLPAGFVDPETSPLPAGQAPDVISIRNVAIPDHTYAATGAQRTVLVVKDSGGLLACRDISVPVS